MLSVTDGLGYPDDGAGSNEQCLMMFCEGEGKTGMIQHDDQFRGVQHCYLDGIGCGGSQLQLRQPGLLPARAVGGRGLQARRLRLRLRRGHASTRCTASRTRWPASPRAAVPGAAARDYPGGGREGHHRHARPTAASTNWSSRRPGCRSCNDGEMAQHRRTERPPHVELRDAQ